MWEEILADARESNPAKRDEEFSVREFAQEANIGKDTAKKLLAQYVKEGKLKERRTAKAIYYTLV
jgi:response regulator of citrate/malate metabolism